MGTELFPIEKQPGLGVNHALPSVIDVKKKGSAIPVNPICDFMAELTLPILNSTMQE
jgi:hypothetical protein